MAKTVLKFLPILLLALWTFNASAQAPANDDCANAIAVALDEVVEANNSEATTDGPAHADDCASSGTTPDSTYKDMWYTFTPDFDGTVLWSLCQGNTNFDTKIFAYEGTDCQPTDDDIVGCSEDGSGACGVYSEVLFDVENGVTYLLRVGAYGDGSPGESGDFTFTIEEFIPSVENDDCANAIAIGLVEGYSIDTQEATTDGPDHPDNPCFGFGSVTADRDIWFTFTPDFTGAVEWSTCDMVTFDTRLAVYGPNVDCPVEDGDLYACNDDGSGCPAYSSKLTFDVEEGQTYLLRLGGFGGDSGIGTFDLIEIVPPDPPANDDCANASDLPYVLDVETADNLDVVFEGTTVDGFFDNETFEFPVCLGNQAGGEFSDVWYTFNTLGNTELEVRLNSATVGSEFFIDLWDDCMNRVDTSIIKGSCQFTTEEETFVTDTITGLPDADTQYYIRVTTRLTSDVPGEFWFQIVGDITSDVEELTFSNFNFFPNPVTDLATTQFNLKESDEVTIQVLNTLGQQIQREYLGRLPAGEQRLQIDLQDLPTGIYFYNLQVGDSQRTVRFVKH